MFICCTYHNTICLSCVQNIEFWCSFHLMLCTMYQLMLLKLDKYLTEAGKLYKKTAKLAWGGDRRRKKLKNISQHKTCWLSGHSRRRRFLFAQVFSHQVRQGPELLFFAVMFTETGKQSPRQPKKLREGETVTFGIDDRIRRGAAGRSSHTGIGSAGHSSVGCWVVFVGLGGSSTSR